MKPKEWTREEAEKLYDIAHEVSAWGKDAIVDDILTVLNAESRQAVRP